jgi:general secretion pathway protein D
VGDLCVQIQNYLSPIAMNAFNNPASAMPMPGQGWGAGGAAGGKGAAPFSMPSTAMGQIGLSGGSSFGGDAGFAVPGSGGRIGQTHPGPGTQVDFQPLIDLIQQTIEPNSWNNVGGAGSIEGFQPNLSLVISQTQAVHDQIADLLRQLRRLQDLQVTVEVRFITLTEDFLERIGVDFDLDIDDDSQRPLQPFGRDTDGDGFADILRDLDHMNGTTVGTGGPDGLFSGDLDIPFRTGGFAVGRPMNFSNPALTFGMAFLSDIEVFLFLEAVQQDNRTNVLQAPKVTLFNGQFAFVFSGIVTPFVSELTPVVANGSIAFDPTVEDFFEGAGLFVQAIISADRRYVRLQVSPFFNDIQGERRFPITASAQQVGGGTGGGAGQNIVVSAEIIRPIFALNIVGTTVSVPDGGTVLLGGLKSKTEERKEFGTPILNKIPYINRLFSNTGVGTVTTSLLLMVSPRIIIQEEEEELLGKQEAY